MKTEHKFRNQSVMNHTESDWYLNAWKYYQLNYVID
mgnify:CR=1 FL=1